MSTGGGWYPVLINVTYKTRSCISGFGGIKSVQYSQCSQHIIVDMGKLTALCSYLSNRSAMAGKGLTAR